MDYKQYVESLAVKGQNETFCNSGPIHAAIVMSRIFKHSTNHVRIFSGGFNGTVSNDEDYLKYLDRFLKNNGKLEILVEEDMSNNENSKIFGVLKKYPKNVTIKKATEYVYLSKTNEPVHFAVGDDIMLRLETGISDYTAQVNFGDAVLAKRVSQIFDSLWCMPNAKTIFLA